MPDNDKMTYVFYSLNPLDISDKFKINEINKYINQNGDKFHFDIALKYNVDGCLIPASTEYCFVGCCGKDNQNIELNIGWTLFTEYKEENNKEIVLLNFSPFYGFDKTEKMYFTILAIALNIAEVKNYTLLYYIDSEDEHYEKLINTYDFEYYKEDEETNLSLLIWNKTNKNYLGGIYNVK